MKIAKEAATMTWSSKKKGTSLTLPMMALSAQGQFTSEAEAPARTAKRQLKEVIESLSPYQLQAMAALLSAESCSDKLSVRPRPANNTHQSAVNTASSTTPTAVSTTGVRKTR